MVARPSGSLVSFTLYCFSTRGSTSFSTNSAYRPDMVSYSRPRSLPWASPLPLPMEMAIITGTRCCGDQIVQGREQSAVGSVRADDERRGRAGDVLLGDIHGHLAGVGSGVAGGDDQLGGVGGVGRAKGAGLARDAGIDLAVGGIHGEVEDCSFGRRPVLIRRRGLWVGPRMKFPSALAGALAPSGSSFAVT